MLEDTNSLDGAQIFISENENYLNDYAMQIRILSHHTAFGARRFHSLPYNQHVSCLS